MNVEDPRLIEAKAMPIAEIADRLGVSGLKRCGIELTGACPVCGGDDRFSINTRKNIFNCRACGGGDGIKLAELVQGCDFKTALAFLCGERGVEIDPKEVERRRRNAAAARRKSEAQAEAYRTQAITDAKSIWRAAEGFDTKPILEYFEIRGIKLDTLPACFRLQPRRPYYAKSAFGGYSQVYSGPCMIAAIQRPDGRLTAVHQTWIDREMPNGKAVILDAAGKPLDVKKVRGSKKGCAIRLTAKSVESDTLVMGEGIETTLTAKLAGVFPDAMYWAGVDLGNMAGRMQRIEGARWSGYPDLGDASAFVPPPWVRRLIFIQDGDSNPKATRAKLESGLRRAMDIKPGLIGQIVHPGEGIDLNDLLNKGAGE